MEQIQQIFEIYEIMPLMSNHRNEREKLGKISKSVTNDLQKENNLVRQRKGIKRKRKKIIECKQKNKETMKV